MEVFRTLVPWSSKVLGSSRSRDWWSRDGLTYSTLHTALLGIPQGVLVCIWIGAGAFLNEKLPANSRTIVCALFMLPTIGGALGFLLAPDDAYVGRLICL
jgi:hypothetical protein